MVIGDEQSRLPDHQQLPIQPTPRSHRSSLRLDGVLPPGSRLHCVDGTKLRADSNKHKVVWAKNTKRYKQKVQQKINDVLVEIEQANAKEQEYYGDHNLEELGECSTLTSDDVKEQVQRLNDILQQAPPAPKPARPAGGRTAKALTEISTKLLPKLEYYEQQEKTLAGRNSYAKTDPAATVFLSKDGQLLPSYNLLIGTQHQFLVNYSLHQRRASESDAFPAHLRRLHSLVGRHPALVMGDSAFGSEENYALLSEHQIGNYLKYNTFHLEQKRKYRNNPYRKENFLHDAANDTYRCPQGGVLTLKQVRTVASTNGYNSIARSYQCSNCHDCPVATQCKRGDGNRTIYVNPTLDAYRAQARTNLNSDVGFALRKQRGIDVEPPFGDIKFNQAYTRCRLRGQEKVNIEIGLLSIAHNIKKVARWLN
ncbi:MAG: transposase [Bacteroidetes bacterium]|nr:transposase [Bacteroidota bacterium]